MSLTVLLSALLVLFPSFFNESLLSDLFLLLYSSTVSFFLATASLPVSVSAFTFWTTLFLDDPEVFKLPSFCLTEPLFSFWVPSLELQIFSLPLSKLLVVLILLFLQSSLALLVILMFFWVLFASVSSFSNFFFCSSGGFSSLEKLFSFAAFLDFDFLSSLRSLSDFFETDCPFLYGSDLLSLLLQVTFSFTFLFKLSSLIEPFFPAVCPVPQLSYFIKPGSFRFTVDLSALFKLKSSFLQVTFSFTFFSKLSSFPAAFSVPQASPFFKDDCSCFTDELSWLFKLQSSCFTKSDFFPDVVFLASVLPFVFGISLFESFFVTSWSPIFFFLSDTRELRLTSVTDDFSLTLFPSLPLLLSLETFLIGSTLFPLLCVSLDVFISSLLLFDKRLLEVSEPVLLCRVVLLQVPSTGEVLYPDFLTWLSSDSFSLFLDKFLVEDSELLLLSRLPDSLWRIWSSLLFLSPDTLAFSICFGRFAQLSLFVRLLQFAVLSTFFSRSFRSERLSWLDVIDLDFLKESLDLKSLELDEVSSFITVVEFRFFSIVLLSSSLLLLSFLSILSDFLFSAFSFVPTFREELSLSTSFSVT